jgi:hypothetical protein
MTNINPLRSFGYRYFEDIAVHRLGRINRSQWAIGLVVVVFGAVFAGPPAQASNTVATIQSVLLLSGANLVYVYPTGGVINEASCGGSNGSYYSFSMSRTMGNAYLAALLAAQARGATVTFYGTGGCTDQSVSETLDYFTVGP